MSQTTRARADKRARAKTEQTVAQALEAAQKRMAAKKERPEITADQIVTERDTKGLSWKQVAVNLGLGSPSAARSAYTRLTGRHHSTSDPVTTHIPRSAAGVVRATVSVDYNDDTDQDHIIAAITHHNLRIVRRFRGIDIPEEWVHVNRIEKFAYEGEDECLVVHLFTKEVCECAVRPQDADTGVARAFRVRDIKEIS